jgi:ABC-type Na+ transport system ATPase subunit NatA
VEAICDSFAIIHKWKIVANDTISSLSEPLEDFFMKSIESNTSPSESFRIE